MSATPDFDPAADSAPAARQQHSPQVWAMAREEYLAGDSAPEVCARHGIALSTFRDRAKKEGWRRADRPLTGGAPREPFDYSAELDAEGRPPSPLALSDDAWEGLVRTIRQDRPRDALAWLRLYRALAEFARAERLPFEDPVAPGARMPGFVAENVRIPATPEEVAELDPDEVARIFLTATPADVPPEVLEPLFDRARAVLAARGALNHLAERDELDGAESGEERLMGLAALDELDGPNVGRRSPMPQRDRLAA